MTETPRRTAAPELGARRLLLLSTGAASAGFLPFWVNWLRDHYPDVELRCALTRSALRFVTEQTVALLTGKDVLIDDWGQEARAAALHVELAEWADAFAVHPASADFIARLALGRCDSPVLLAMQCSTGVLGVAPSVPPGMTQNPVYQQHLRALADRSNIVVAPTQVGRSATTGRYNQGVAAPLWVLIEQIERQRVVLAAAEADPTSRPVQPPTPCAHDTQPATAGAR
jgi:phosphopantothenoylcysteine synthetase/decarboxylase